MQFKKSAVVGVLITVYLSTDSWCHYIPEKKSSSAGNKNESAGQHSKSGQIRICGNALTTIIIEGCDGIVGSLDQADSGRGSVQTKITENCCDQACPLDYLQSYCGGTPLFTIKKTARGELLNKFDGSRPTRPKTRTAGRERQQKEKKKAEVERQNGVSRSWPTIQIGTISPEIDKFGGQPIVVVKKDNSNSV